jgi:hypothetical protein
MNRRHFLKKTLGLTALMSCPTSLAWAVGESQCSVDDGSPLCISFEASGGWDPQAFCDPVAHSEFNSFLPTGSDTLIFQEGNLRYAPFDVVGGEPIAYLCDDGQDFFKKYKDDLLIINGIDTGTASHEVGARHVWSGHSRPGFPSYGALLAAIQEYDNNATTLPLAFISTGGFDATAGLLPVARTGRVSTLLDMSRPYITPAGRTGVPYDLIHPEAVQEILGFQEARRVRLLNKADHPPRQKEILEGLPGLWEQEKLLQGFATYLQEGSPVPFPDSALYPDYRIMIHSAHSIVAAMKAGLCRSGHLSKYGFDTHDLHDDMSDPSNPHNAFGQRIHLRTLLRAVDYTAQLLCQVGLWHRTTLVIGSDFGRTRYNAPLEMAARGKDHWPITSMMVMGGGIEGNRVIGETTVDEGLSGIRSRRVQLTGAGLVPTDDDNGFYLKPAHIHDALRRHGGIHDHPLASQFDLGLAAEEQDLPILS